MKGYFSRLIGQIGIKFGTGGDSTLDVYEQPPIMSKKHDKITPIHDEKKRFIAPHTDQTVGKIQRNDKEVTEKSILPKDKNIQHSTEKKIETKIPEEPSHRTSKTDKLKQIECEPEEINTAVFGRKIQTSSEMERGRNKVEDHMSDEKFIQHFVTSSGLSHSESEEDHVVEPDVRPGDRSGKDHIWQATFETVREGVCGAPVEGGDEIEKRNEFRAVQIDKKTTTAVGGEQVLATPYPEATESQAKREPEIHDYHLSIGTISLTIEEPQKEIQRGASLHIKSDRKSLKENISSRLNRHYIRIR